MNRYRIRISVDGKRKLYYIEDQENYDIVLLPSKYLKHKADANRSPNTVRRLALSICYYLNYLDQTGTELLQVAKKSFEEQSSHFGQFLYWLVEGRHITDNRTAKTGNGTCNAYLKDVFGFFLYLADNGYTEPLRVLAYNQITVSNAVGVKRTIRSKSFKGYLKEKDRNVRAAQEPEIIDILRACTNLRDQLLLLLLAETGFRIGEILGVDYTKDIDYEKQVLKVYFRDDNDNEARAKNAEYRSAKISRETFEFLLHYLAEYRRLLQRQSLLFFNIRGETAGKPMRVESVYDMLDRMEEKTGIKLMRVYLKKHHIKAGDYVFQNSKGGPYRSGTFRYNMLKYCELNDIQNGEYIFRSHDYRHTIATCFYDSGVSLQSIRDYLGHDYEEMTEQYIDYMPKKIEKASEDYFSRHSLASYIKRGEEKDG